MKKNTLILILIVTAITILGGFLRFYKITQNPPSLTGDEISFAYSAYSILKTGKDEHGKFLPLTLEAVGDYKNPLPAYLMIPSIKMFGLTDFAVRLPNALLGTISIPIFFMFLLDIFKKKKIALLGSFFLSISAWHIFYSRFAYEGITAGLFILLGIWFFTKMLNGKIIWAILSSFFLTLTIYTAPAPRLFVPIFVTLALIVNLSKFKKNLKTNGVFIVTCIVLGLPMVYTTLFQGSGTRFNVVFISHDIEFSRYVLLKYFSSISDLPLLFFFWIKRYLSYFNPGFLFFNGLDATAPSPIGLGILYIFEIPLLIAGITSFIKNKIRFKELFFIWIFAGILPDSITNNQKHTGRLLYLFPVLIILTALGAIELYNLLTKVKKTHLKLAIASSFSIIVFLVLTHAFLIISADFPRDKGESFDEGLREAVYYVQVNRDKYKEIVFDPARGVAAPNIITNSFLYVLFYTKYDPLTYQAEQKITSMPGYESYYKFEKYTFRHIDWQKDQYEKGVLFIGSPWSLPEKDLKNGELLKKIYLTGGSVAFFIVSPK